MRLSKRSFYQKNYFQFLSALFASLCLSACVPVIIESNVESIEKTTEVAEQSSSQPLVLFPEHVSEQNSQPPQKIANSESVSTQIELIEHSIVSGTAGASEQNLEKLPDTLAISGFDISEESEDIKLVDSVPEVAHIQPHTRPQVEPIQSETGEHQRSIDALCNEVGNKLGSVSTSDCLNLDIQFGGGFSHHDRALSAKDFLPEDEYQSKARVLVLGGIHGDEYSSISIMFKWMNQLLEGRADNYYWRFLPLVNPDGLLDSSAIRQNANGVDLNRNFPTDDWENLAHKNWIQQTGRNPRRFPGEAAGSEPEVQWVVEQIKQFKPDVIVSVHAPYHLLDFDGPIEAPDKIGELYLHQLGVYPGSLGNYGGLQLGIPVVTLELPSAGIMPSNDQINNMWADLLVWLNEKSDKGTLALSY